MSDNASILITFIKDIKIKIDDKIITLKPEIIEKLVLPEKSFFRGAIDFYKNDTSSEKKPIDLSSAPHADRFDELVPFLEKWFSGAQSLCHCKNPEELFELVEYLGIMPVTSLDNLAHKGRVQSFTKWKKEEQILFDMVNKLFSSLNDKGIEKFAFHFYNNGNLDLVDNNTSSNQPRLYSSTLRKMSIETVITKLKEIINSRLTYMKYTYLWEYRFQSDMMSLSLTIKSLQGLD